MGRAVYINGGTGNNIYDSYIHVEGASKRCCDTRDGVLVNGSNSITIQGNFIAYSESNVEAFANNAVIIGNFLLNPQGLFPRGQQIQTGAGTNVRITNNFLVSTRDATLGPAIRTHSSASVLMSQGVTNNPPEDGINIYTTQYVDIENNYVTGGLDASTPGSGGAQSPSGCGILGADSDNVSGANHVTIKNNVVVNTGQCGIGIGMGINQTVVGNKVMNLNLNTGGNTAIFIWKQYTPACGPVLLNGNIGAEVKPGATAPVFGTVVDAIPSLATVSTRISILVTPSITPPEECAKEFAHGSSNHLAAFDTTVAEDLCCDFTLLHADLATAVFEVGKEAKTTSQRHAMLSHCRS